MSIYEDMKNVGKTAYEHYKERGNGNGISNITSSNALLQSRLDRFKTTLDQINRVQKYSVMTPFINIDLDGFKINTLDKNCVDYFMSMQITMNGSGVANEVTINICYVPSPNSQDINVLGEILGGITSRWLNCTLQYGYSVNGYNLVSPKYAFLITSYSEEMRQGALLYTIKGYSSLTELVEQTFNFHRITKENHQDPMEMVAYNIKHLVGDAINIDISECVKTVRPTNVDTIHDKTIFQYLDTVLAQFTDEDNDVNVVYWYELVDTTFPSTIVIHRSKPKTVKKHMLEDIYMTFDWMGNQSENRNNLVLDFRTQYQGEINLAITKDSIRDVNAINSEGNTINGKGLNDILSGDTADADFQDTINKWVKNQQWAYKGTLNVIGIPCDIPLGAFIKINPLIYGKLHHTAGVYMITKATSNLDGGGFTTSLELIKVPLEEKETNIAERVSLDISQPTQLMEDTASDFINQSYQDVVSWADKVVETQINRTELSEKGGKLEVVNPLLIIKP